MLGSVAVDFGRWDADSSTWLELVPAAAMPLNRREALSGGSAPSTAQFSFAVAFKPPSRGLLSQVDVAQRELHRARVGLRRARTARQRAAAVVVRGMRRLRLRDARADAAKKKAARANAGAAVQVISFQEVRCRTRPAVGTSCGARVAMSPPSAARAPRLRPLPQQVA